MRLFATPPYRDVPELLDLPGEASPAELETTLRDIRRANIFGLGTWVVKHHLEQFLRLHSRSKTFRILDVATGSGDIPEELCRWFQRNGREVELVLTDIMEPVLNVARRRISSAAAAARIEYVVCNATALPFADREFDVAICSLAFHHLSLRQAGYALNEMQRVTRLGFIVNDIYRSKGAWYMAIALTRLTTSNRLTRHDGPASVLRSYTPGELRKLASSAGVRAEVYTHPFWRAALVGTHS